MAPFLATSDRGHKHGTFEDFCAEQRVRIALRDFRRHDGETYEEMWDRLAREENDHFIRPVLLRDAEIERRGQV